MTLVQQVFVWGEIIEDQICFPSCCLLILVPVWLEGRGVVLLLLMEACRVMKQTKVKVAISQSKTVCLLNIAVLVVEKDI